MTSYCNFCGKRIETSSGECYCIGKINSRNNQVCECDKLRHEVERLTLSDANREMELFSVRKDLEESRNTSQAQHKDFNRMYEKFKDAEQRLSSVVGCLEEASVKHGKIKAIVSQHAWSFVEIGQAIDKAIGIAKGETK